MKGIIHKYSNHLGIILSLVQGVLGGLNSVTHPIYTSYNFNLLLILSFFGLFVPPAGVLINSFMKSDTVSLKLIRKINYYVNFYLFFICYLLSFGVTGFITYYINGGEKSCLILLAFFTSAGLGFTLAYFIDSNIGFRRPKNA